MICPLASPPVPEPDQKTNPRMKTAITANSVHFSWWKLLRIVLSLENPPRQRFALRLSERATIHRFRTGSYGARAADFIGAAIPVSASAPTVGADSGRRRGPVGRTGDGRTAGLRGKCAISE